MANTEDAAKAMVSAISSRHSELLQHTLAGDGAKAAAVLHADFISVDSSGHRSTRAEELANFASGKLKLRSNVVENLQVHAFGPNVAIVTGVAHTKGTWDGKDISGTYKFHQLWSTSSSPSLGAGVAPGGDMQLVASFNGEFTAE